MFGETCHDVAYERHIIEEKEAAARAEAQTTMTIAQFAERTQSNLNEIGLKVLFGYEETAWRGLLVWNVISAER